MQHRSSTEKQIPSRNGRERLNVSLNPRSFDILSRKIICDAEAWTARSPPHPFMPSLHQLPNSDAAAWLTRKLLPQRAVPRPRAPPAPQGRLSVTGCPLSKSGMTSAEALRRDLYMPFLVWHDTQEVGTRGQRQKA